MHAKFVRHMLYPLYSRFGSPDEEFINQFQREFERNQWLSLKAIKKLQWAKLRRIIAYAYAHVEFYHEKFKEFNITPSDIKSPKDMLKLPVITKRELRANFPERVIAKNISPGNLIFDTTSGTTGLPFKIAKDKSLLFLGDALRRRNNRWCGLEMGEKYTILWYPFWADEKINRKIKLLKKIFNSPLRLSDLNLNESKLIKYFNELNKYMPKALIGYWYSIRVLAKVIRKHDLHLDIDICIGCADDAIDREMIESVFHSTTFNRYASNEFHNIANECQERNGLHINADHVFLEFIKDGEHVSDGEIGKIIITDLDNRVMPFIRYELGDMGIPSEELCSCGMGLPLIKRLEGRVLDLIITPKGQLITATYFPSVFKTLGDYIDQYQVVQKKQDKIVAYLVKGKNYQEEISEMILKKVKENIEDVEFSLEFVDSIPPEKSGKYKIIKSEIQHSL